MSTSFVARRLGTMPNPAIGTLLPASTRARVLRYAPFLLFLGLLVLCGYLAARLSWQFAASPTTTVRSASNATAAPAPSPRAGSPAEKIAAAHLFGRARARTPTVAARNAPETSLDLTLAGVAAANPDRLSYAIITSGARGGKDTYGIGARLPGGALVRQILPDRVVIAHDGRLETLRLPWADLANFQPVDQSTGKQTGISENRRQEFQAHPRALADYIRIRPYSKNGNFAGFRVYPGKKPKLFHKAGLMPGDIVTSVNGIRLNTPARSMQAVKALRNAKGAVRLGILRNGHRISVTLNSGG